MLKISSTIFMGLLLAVPSSTIFAAQNPDPNTPTNMQFGNKDLTDVEVKSIHHSGRLLLKRIKVNENAVINGYLEAQDSIFQQGTIVNGAVSAQGSQFKDLTVNGETNLKDVTIEGPVNINGKFMVEHVNFNNVVHLNGNLDATDSRFNKTLSVSGTTLLFDNCAVNDIVIGAAKEKETQSVSLTKSQVANIKFDAGNGVVHVDANSSVGKVTGGTVQK